jgi:hypothetical protein
MKATISLYYNTILVSNIPLEADSDYPEHTFLAHNYIIGIIQRMSLKDAYEVYKLYDFIKTYKSNPKLYTIKVITDITERYEANQVELTKTQIQAIFEAIRDICHPLITEGYLRSYQCILTLQRPDKSLHLEEWHTITRLLDATTGIDNLLLELILKASQDTNLEPIKDALRMHSQGTSSTSLYITIQIYSYYLHQWRVLDNIQDIPIAKNQSKWILNSLNKYLTFNPE